jgi:hypothetical protein
MVKVVLSACGVVRQWPCRHGQRRDEKNNATRKNVRSKILCRNLNFPLKFELKYQTLAVGVRRSNATYRRDLSIFLYTDHFMVIEFSLIKIYRPSAVQNLEFNHDTSHLKIILSWMTRQVRLMSVCGY